MEQSLFIRIRGRIQGPFALPQLQELTKQGRLGRLHEVSEDGTSWVQASQFPAIFSRDAHDQKGVSESQSAVPPTAHPVEEDAPVAGSPAEPAAPRATHNVWFYSKDDREPNKADLSDLRFLIGKGHLSPDTLVWTDGMPNWVMAKHVPQLSVSSGASAKTAEEEISRATLDAFALARPWIIFVAVFGFVVVGLTALSAISILALGAVADSASLVLQAVVTFVLMVVCCRVSYLLLCFGIQIGRLQLLPKTLTLHEALWAQHRFWRAAGIALLAMIAIGIVVFAVLIYFGAVTGGSFRVSPDRLVLRRSSRSMLNFDVRK